MNEGTNEQGMENDDDAKGKWLGVKYRMLN